MKLTLEAIHARCEEESDCLMWTGGTNSNGIPYGADGRVSTNLRRLVWQMENPKRSIPAGKYVVMKCRSAGCLCPDHMTLKTRKELGQMLSKEGAYTRPGVLASKIAKRRAVSTRMNMETAQEIRAADTTAREEAEKRGLSISMVHGIRQGRFWSDRPMHMPANSVFNLAAKQPGRRAA